jgi:anti-sigma-K factor RskA
MDFQVVSSGMSTVPTDPPPALSPASETVELLRQLLEIQREQLAYQRAAAAAHDVGARWRAYLTRWQQEFPDLGDACRKAMPDLERSFGKLIAELTNCVNDDDEAIDNDFALQEFLDRYGMRLAQLGNILNMVAPLAEASSQPESAP